MRRNWIIASLVLALLTGCGFGQSRFNPLNWSGGSRDVPAASAAGDVQTDTRPLMSDISGLSVEATQGGVIVTARGLPPQQGWFDGELVPIGAVEGGRLDYAFRAAPPFEPTRVSTPQSREIVVGVFLSDRELRGVSEIRVTGTRNARAVRR